MVMQPFPTFELPLPRVRLSFADYNLGLTPPLTDAHAKIGVAWDGPMTPVRVTSGREVAERYRGGPLASAAAIALLQTAPVVMQRVAADVPGSISPVHVQRGMVAPTTEVPMFGTATEMTPTLAPVPIAPPDSIPLAPVSFEGSPTGDYRIGVEVTRWDGSTPLAVRYNIDGIWGQEIAVNGWPGLSMPVEDTGVNMTLLTPQPGETYWVDVTGPAATMQAVVQSLEALLETRPTLRFVHVVGAATPALVAAVDAILAERERRAYYTHVVLEARPRGATESMAAYLDEVQQQFAAVFSTRVSLALDGGLMYNPLTKRVENHNSAWKATAVRPTRPLGEAPYRTRTGPMIGMTGDLAFDAGLVGSSGRFLALRTFDALNGIYVAHWPTLAPAGSDYNEVQRREVADAAARAAYAAALAYLGDDLRVDVATGRILETEAQAFEAFVTGRVQAELGGNVSGVRVRLNREENILSTEHIEFTVGIIPLGYLKYIDVTVGFENPYLSAATAAAADPVKPTNGVPVGPAPAPDNGAVM